MTDRAPAHATEEPDRPPLVVSHPRIVGAEIASALTGWQTG